MCTNYTPASASDLMAFDALGAIDLPDQEWPEETFPGYLAPILSLDSAGSVRCELARFGLLPRWCRSREEANRVGRGTYNARSETVAEKPSFRSAWRERQFALVPMRHYYEPCWESGRALRWRIARPDGRPFAVAGLYEHWLDRTTGETVRSFTMLTVNADQHPLMRRMHRPGDEKRMLSMVGATDHERWLTASPEEAAQFLQPAPDEPLVGAPAAVAPSAAPEAPQRSLDF
ncbi:SOS response-associated peptidase family protein [Hydrogenophaga sp. 5NK40-0174]|uniref:SOS response-associated peptidase n=1 Tax=Hydrogenophaga sp. 5NK40-0174 TaxID=3127649 RepID=UPI00310BCA55